MSQEKLSLEEAANEYQQILNDISGGEAAYHVDSFIAGVNFREAELMGWITELRKYSRHNNTCDIIEYKDTCSCGFAILLNGIEQNLKGIL